MSVFDLANSSRRKIIAALALALASKRSGLGLGAVASIITSFEVASFETLKLCLSKHLYGLWRFEY